MKKKSAPHSSDKVPIEKVLSRNSKPPLFSHSDNKTSGKAKEKSLPFFPHNFKIKK